MNYLRKLMKMITKEQKIFNDINFNDGQVILFDKLKGFTSFSVVNRVRGLISVKKVGHAGTLDPLATGLLIICTGKATKKIDEFQNLEKTYSGIISLGKRTPSIDLETDFIEEKSIENIDSDKIYNVRNSFLGEIEQTPPMYSAIKHKGKSLYKLARKGKEIFREKRVVTIKNFEIEKIELPDVYFKITCSKGTYIRVIADDFGAQLGCGAYLKELRREKIGDYSVQNAFTLEDFKACI